ncbi:Hypothetical_protein [Hexamita inflata]|uniref:Hypothetical_protein n=1 Tax=Hexamita inflata TaxID=28002 RepID=A0AA86V5C4_9EUKA|nr:Hypothetical protein HINF_LOCUS64696 [Hexamita inflata]
MCDNCIALTGVALKLKNSNRESKTEQFMFSNRQGTVQNLKIHHWLPLQEMPGCVLRPLDRSEEYAHTHCKDIVYYFTLIKENDIQRLYYLFLYINIRRKDKISDICFVWQRSSHIRDAERIILKSKLHLGEATHRNVKFLRMISFNCISIGRSFYQFILNLC